jgi:hypothetical protein
MFIYVIENKLTKKLYVGKTSKTILERWKRHIADSRRHNTKLYNAIKKYGAEYFDIYAIENVDSLDKLNAREIYWIDVLEPELNMTKGGDGGFIHSQKGKTWKIKDTSRMKNKKTITEKVIEGRKRVAGGNNYQSIYSIETPWGMFETWVEACDAARILRSQGITLIVTDEKTLKKYCAGATLNAEGRRTPKEWRGKHTHSIGFNMKEKHYVN